MIYLDAASSEKLHPKAKEAMFEAFDEWANPSGLSQANKRSYYRLEECRKIIKEVCNVKNNAELIFTSSASESNNIIFNQSPLPILISKFEHPSVSNHPKVEGIIDLKDEKKLEKFLKEKNYLVSLSYVNNESGLRIANAKIIEKIKKLGSKVHVDASQAKEIDFDNLKCDYMTISSHKIGGPIGIAGIITKTVLKPIIYGGGQEFNIRSGTQAVPLVEGFAAAVKELQNRQENDAKLFKILHEQIESKYFFSNFVKESFDNHIICLLTYKRSGTEVHAYMDMNNISIAYGSACSSGAINGPKILNLYSLPSYNGIRLSFGWHSKEEDVYKFCSLFNNFM